MYVRVTTWQDMIDHVLDYLGSNPGGDAARDARRATLNAYRELNTRHHWSYYYFRGRLMTVAPYATGTVAYTHGNLTVTLTGGTFPAWAGLGDIVLNNILYPIASNPTATTVLLTPASNPGADVASTAAWSIYQDSYVLPADFLAMDRVILVNNAYSLWWDHPSAWLERQRIYHSPAIPRFYTVFGDPDHFGAMKIAFFPAPDDQYPFDFIYHRKPRPLLLDDYHAGTVATTASSAAVAGTNTAWTSSMVGSILRISPDNLSLPTGLAGDNPPLWERQITAVSSATSITLDSALDQTLGPLQYRISDPMDLEEGSLLTALQRCCEWQVAVSRSMKSRQDAFGMWQRALVEAMEADSRNFAAESASMSHMFPYRLAQMPRGPDVS